MGIEERSLGRSDLKKYFVKNAIPTESDFADLIEASLNQRDDQLVKPPGDPLSIEAVGDAAGPQKVLQFYRDFEKEPEWALSLNPRTKGDDPRSARAGFAVTDGKGEGRLYIDPKGNVGIGTVSPKARLEVRGGDVHLERNSSIFFADNGEIRSLDPNHRILFRRNEDKMELREYGEIIFSPGATRGTETAKVVIRRDGKLDVDGTVEAGELKTTLHAAGGKAVRKLSSSNKWGAFPDLKKVVTLRKSTNVIAFYNVTMVGGSSHLCTRLSVDGKVQDASRAITGDTKYWSPCGLWMGTLAAGKHTLEVEYRTPKGGSNNPGADWSNRTLQVLVLGA